MSYTLETGISQAFADRIEVRGYDLVALAGQISFGDMVYLLLRGELPTPQAGQMVETMLVIMAEHSINAPSTFAARTVANSGSPLQTAVAAGISAIGDHHGGAGEAFARILQAAVAAAPQPLDATAVATKIVATAAAGGQRLPGFGHRIHNPDPRAVYLLALGRELGLAGPHTDVAEAIVTVLYERTGRALPLNVDGALAALSSDMGFDPLMAKGLFVMARTAGLLAHVQEEITQGKPMKFTPRAEVRYTGPVRSAGDAPL